MLFEIIDGLSLSLLQNPEVFLLQIFHWISAVVSDDHIYKNCSTVHFQRGFRSCIRGIIILRNQRCRKNCRKRRHRYTELLHWSLRASERLATSRCNRLGKSQL